MKFGMHNVINNENAIYLNCNNTYIHLEIRNTTDSPHFSSKE